MKKLISCVLAVALVFSLMGVSVFAGDKKLPFQGEGIYDVIGTNGDQATDTQNSYKDGADTIDSSKTASGDVTVNFNTGSSSTDTNVIIDKYAIDIEYKDLIIDLTDIDTTEDEKKYTFVWDVNVHKYVQIDENGTVVDSVKLDNDYVIDAYQVINHSSLPIYYKGVLTPDDAKPDSITLTLSDSTSQKLDRVVPAEDGGNGTVVKSANWHTITASSTDWLTTINQLAAVYGLDDNVIGTITVTFSSTEIAS